MMKIQEWSWDSVRWWQFSNRNSTFWFNQIHKFKRNNQIIKFIFKTVSFQKSKSFDQKYQTKWKTVTYSMKLNEHVINKDLNQYHHSGTLFQTTKGIFGKVIHASDFKRSHSHWSVWKKNYSTWIFPTYIPAFTIFPTGVRGSKTQMSFWNMDKLR